MSEREPYIGGPTGGVPEEVFQQGFRGIVKGVSGQTSLECRADTRELTIRDIDRGIYTPFRVTLSLGSALKMNVITKLENGRKHPDLYAAKLIKRGIEYFEELPYFKEAGDTVDKIEGNWQTLYSGQKSDNLEQYNAYLEELKKTRDIMEEDMKNAAKQTWTGKLAGSLGYENVEELRTSSTGNIIVLFGKDK